MAIWIIEASVFGNGGEAFAAAVHEAGGELWWLNVDDEFRGRYGRWEPEQAVVFRGSFEAAESFRRARPEARPGVIGEPEALRCSAYYPALGERRLNLDPVFLTLGELRPRWPELQARFGPAPFVRPDSGAKAFTGQVVADLDRFEARERPYLESMDPKDRVVVAAPRRIEAEWRTVVVGREVVAGSRYKLDGNGAVDPEVPTNVLAFAQTVAAEIEPPAAAYMIDVAKETDGRLSVVELNAFASSSLYACDLVPIVAAVERWIETIIAT